MSPVLYAVAMILALVTFHELGHFLVGRFFGIAVEQFSVGFGPAIAKWTKKGTEYRLAWIPLGGYVRFSGMHVGDQPKQGVEGIKFFDAPYYARVATIAAGPFANILLAFLIYLYLGFVGIDYLPAKIGEVIPDSAAEASGLQYRDEVFEINNMPVRKFNDFRKIVSQSPGVLLNVKVMRGGKVVNLKLTPSETPGRDMFGRRTTIGLAGTSTASLSAHVVVLDNTSIAFAQNIRTGDRFVSLKTDAANGGKAQSLRHFEEVCVFIETWSHGQSRPIALEYGLEKLGTATTLIQNMMLPPNSTCSIFGLNSPDFLVKSSNINDVNKLMTGDVIVNVAGKKMTNRFSYATWVSENTAVEKPVFEVLRNGETLAISVPSEVITRQLPEGAQDVFRPKVEFLATLTNPELKLERFTFPGALIRYAYSETLQQAGMLVTALGELVTAKLSVKSLGGPLTIFKVAHDAADAGIKVFLGFTSLLSVNLAVINLVPIPATDGGQIVINTIEWIRRRRLSLKAVENFQKIGFIMIFSLLVLATYNDISRFWSTLVRTIVE